MASPPPSPNPAPNPSEKEALLTNEMESVDFASLLADLESMPHTNINARPIGKAGSRKSPHQRDVIRDGSGARAHGPWPMAMHVRGEGRAHPLGRSVPITCALQ